MKKFKQMIEQVKLQNEIFFIEESKSTKTFPKSGFFHFVEKCQPFIFYPLNEGPLHPDDLESHTDYGAPFNIWSAEMVGDGFLTVPTKPEDLSITTHCECFLAVEQKEDWIYFCLMTNAIRSHFQAVVVPGGYFNGIAKALVDRMNSNKEVVGTEHTRERVKIGTGKEKKHITIRKVIHVKPKRDKTTISETNKVIVWGSRWWVRGSWHHFWLDEAKSVINKEKIGKCRDGCYCEQGRTWHVEHIKGNKDMPVINKTRIVNQG